MNNKSVTTEIVSKKKIYFRHNNKWTLRLQCGKLVKLTRSVLWKRRKKDENEVQESDR